MVNLFDIPNHIVDTSNFLICFTEILSLNLKESFAKYVGAKYAYSANSASSLIYLALRRFSGQQLVQLPSTMPIVVPNVRLCKAGHRIMFYNDIDWVGGYYHLHEDIFDSAQQVDRNQYADLDKGDSIMIFSFYPTKPVSGCDGEIVVSNNKEKMNYFKTMTMNGVPKQ